MRILLTASEEARLARRAREVHGTADAAAVEATRDGVLRRDADDSTVVQFPTAADGVVTLDSSDLDLDGTVDAVLDDRRARSPGAAHEPRRAVGRRTSPPEPVAVPGWSLRIGRFLAHGVWDTDVTGADHVPPSGPVILAANHTERRRRPAGHRGRARARCT